MVTANKCINQDDLITANGIIENRFNRWQLVGTYETVEPAALCRDQLLAAGVQCHISLVGGLSVLACKSE